MMAVILGCILGSIIGATLSGLGLHYYFKYRQSLEDAKALKPEKTYRPFTQEELRVIEKQNVFRRSDEIVAQEEDRE